jgi:hypothetical protein
VNAPQHPALFWLQYCGQRYPDVWRDYAELMAELKPGSWPSWCWCPSAAASAVIELSKGNVKDTMLVATLAAWRATQGVYRFDPDLQRALMETPVKGELPTEVFTRMPAWAVYIETPGVDYALRDGPVRELHGFWASLDYMGSEQIPLLILTYNFGDTIGCIQLPLTGSLDETLKKGFDQIENGIYAAAAQDVGSMLSLLLYLCADGTEVERVELPPRVVKGKKRAILPCAKKLTLHPTGVRLGAALRAARARHYENREHQGGTKTPHVRGCHWHHYWTGPRAEPEKRRLTVKWLPPIAVKLLDVPLAPTVRKVRPDPEPVRPP